MPPYAESESSRVSKLSTLLQQNYSHIPIITLPRKHFNDEKGKHHIVDFCMQEDVAGLLFGVSTKYVRGHEEVCRFHVLNDMYIIIGTSAWLLSLVLFSRF